MQRKSLIATAAIFCCRFTGLLREVVYTGLFGTTGALDAFLTAFRVPNMLRDMFAEGALSQSFTSVMSKVEKVSGAQTAWKLANRVASQLMSLMLCFVAIGVLTASFFMQQLYPQRALFSLQPNIEVLPQSAGSDSLTFLGFHENTDGMPEARFTYSGDKPAGFTTESCLRYDALADLEPGSLIQLESGHITLPQGKKVKVEEQDFMMLAANLCRIMWPFIMLASISALCMGALNVFGLFGIPNLASAAFNLTTVALGLLFGWMIDPEFGPRALYGFAIAIVAGGAMQILVQIPSMRKLGWRPHFDIGFAWAQGKLVFTDSAVRRVWLLMLPGVIAAGITQSNVFINTSFALYLPGGSVTALSSAFHLWQLPVALFGVATGMVVLPAISRMVVADGRSEIAQHLAQALRFVAFFAVPSTVFLGLWGEEIVSIFFQRGRFDEASSALTGQVLSSYSIGLLGYAGMKVLQPVFLALEKPWAPAGLALFSCAISVGLNYFFVHVLHLGVSWLALTTALVTTLNFAFYFIYLRHLLGGMASNILVPGILRIMAAGAVLFLSCFLLRSFFMEGFTSWGFWARLGTMALFGNTVGLIYLLSCHLFGVTEFSDFTKKFIKH